MIDNAKLQPSVDAMFAFYRDRRLTWRFARQNCRSYLHAQDRGFGLRIDNRTGPLLAFGFDKWPEKRCDEIAWYRMARSPAPSCKRISQRRPVCAGCAGRVSLRAREPGRLRSR